MDLKHIFRPYILACLVALILALPTFINGAPFFYEDSFGYVARGVGPLRAMGGDFRAGHILLRDELGRAPTVLSATMPVQPVAAESKQPKYDIVWHAGRSIFYSVVTYLSYVFAGFTGVVALQALLVALPITLLWKRCLDLPDRWLLSASALLAFATSLGLFVGLVMPDFMAAVVILISAMLLAFRSRLLIIDMAMLSAVLVYAASVHDSHLVILSILVVGAWVLYLAGFLRKIEEQGYAAPALMTLALCAGLIGSQAYSALAVHITGKPLLRLPHLTAHLVSMPLGADYLNQKCPQAGFDMCLYRDKLPISWIDFMFGHSLWGDLPYPEQQRISNQQVSLLLTIFKDRPVATTVAFGNDALKQLILISYFDLDQARKVPFFSTQMPPAMVNQITSSLLVRYPALLEIQSLVQQTIVLITLPVLVILGFRISATTDPLIRKWRLMAGVVFLGVVVNGFVCGLLAFPYDRFQVRVIWLIPFLAMTGWALVYSRAKEYLQVARTECHA